MEIPESVQKYLKGIREVLVIPELKKIVFRTSRYRVRLQHFNLDEGPVVAVEVTTKKGRPVFSTCYEGEIWI